MAKEKRAESKQELQCQAMRQAQTGNGASHEDDVGRSQQSERIPQLGYAKRRAAVLVLAQRAIQQTMRVRRRHLSIWTEGAMSDERIARNARG